MNKREFLHRLSMTLGTCFLPHRAGAQETATTTLAAAWRGAHANDHFVGVLHVDWAAGEMQIKASVPIPTRAHGLAAQPDGGFVAVAARPGQWLLRCDAAGKVVCRFLMESESAGRTLDGHLCASADGAWLYSTETNPLSGQGWVAVRDRQSLRKVAEWRTYGAEPHQILTDSTGALMVANGGLLRAGGDKKRDLHLMDSSLVRLDPVTGERLGQWRLKDSRLGMRHLAWSHPDKGMDQPLLGIALQNEHDDLMQRRNSPVLAVWDGENLSTPSAIPDGGGYAGDIVAGPQGGFVLSCLRTNIALQWVPQAPADMKVVARLQAVGALAKTHPSTLAGGVVLAAARGVGRWHPTFAPSLLQWPEPMAVDNHWIVL